MNIITSHGRKAYVLSNGGTDLSVTVDGGHMAPVRFFADSNHPVEPYYISPWQEESESIPGPGVLKSLRGDFFCMPFGGDNEYAGEVHPPHGEVCESPWSLKDEGTEGDITFLELSLSTRVRRGDVTKRIEIRDRQSALYIRHDVEGFTGPVTLGHHAIMPGDRMHYLSTRPLIAGICDTAPPPPASREYYATSPGAFFDSLTSVPTIWKDPANTDCSVFPAREGFVDIIQVFPEVPKDDTPQWFTATVPSHGYLWYSLKNPATLPSTVLWQEHHGRHSAPWNSRNSCLGIEEVLAHLASGLKVSVEPNALSERGLQTFTNLDGTSPFTVRNIQGVCRIPEGFDRVADISFEPGSVVFRSASGMVADTAVDWKFVLS